MTKYALLRYGEGGQQQDCAGDCCGGKHADRWAQDIG